jgi:hypothetical protein
VLAEFDQRLSAAELERKAAESEAAEAKSEAKAAETSAASSAAELQKAIRDVEALGEELERLQTEKGGGQGAGGAGNPKLAKQVLSAAEAKAEMAAEAKGDGQGDGGGLGGLGGLGSPGTKELKLRGEMARIARTHEEEIQKTELALQMEKARQKEVVACCFRRATPLL